MTIPQRLCPKSTRTFARGTHLHIQLFALILKVSRHTCIGSSPFSIFPFLYMISVWTQFPLLHRPGRRGTCSVSCLFPQFLLKIQRLLRSATTRHESCVVGSPAPSHQETQSCLQPRPKASSAIQRQCDDPRQATLSPELRST